MATSMKLWLILIVFLCNSYGGMLDEVQSGNNTIMTEYITQSAIAEYSRPLLSTVSSQNGILVVIDEDESEMTKRAGAKAIAIKDLPYYIQPSLLKFTRCIAERLHVEVGEFPKVEDNIVRTFTVESSINDQSVTYSHCCSRIIYILAFFPSQNFAASYLRNP